MVYSDQLRLLNPALPRRQILYRYGYAMDPDPVMSCPDLKPAARLIYRAILRLCGRGTVCRASVDQIAAQAGVSVRSVQRHVTILTFRELIEVEDTPGAETIFRLLPLPAWILEGRTPILQADRDRETEGQEAGRGGTSAICRPCPERSGALAPRSRRMPSAPEGCQPDGGGVTDCRGRGDSLSPPMKYNKEIIKENLNSLSWPGTQSGTEWTDEPVASEREEVGEELEPVLGETSNHQNPRTPEQNTPAPVVPVPPTPQQIVQTTCQTLGFQPTEAQVGFGVREVATLRAGGFTLPEIGEGARYAAEQGWVRSFAGVKFYLPQALKAVALGEERRKEKGERETPAIEPEGAGGGALSPFLFPLSPDLRRSAAEVSPHRALWEQVLERIEPRIQRQSYRTWFEPTFISDYDGRQVVLETPSTFFQDWLEEHYLALITSAFEEVLGHPVEVTVGVSTGGPGGAVASAKSGDNLPEGGG